MSPLDTEPQAGAVGWDRPEPLPPPRPGRTSTRPAMVVLGLAIVIVGTFVTLGLVSSHPAPSLHSGSRSSAVPGSTLRAEAATTVLAPILTPGEPPINVVNAVVVPVGVVRVGHRDDSAGSGQFDAAGGRSFGRLPGRAARLLRFGNAAPGLAHLRPWTRRARSGRHGDPGPSRRVRRLLLGVGCHRRRHEVPAGRTSPWRDRRHHPSPPTGRRRRVSGRRRRTDRGQAPVDVAASRTGSVSPPVGAISGSSRANRYDHTKKLIGYSR